MKGTTKREKIMKIRSGFISNSSSSSFIVFGKELYSDVSIYSSEMKDILRQGKLYASSWDYCVEGTDFFRITQVMFNLYYKCGAKGLQFYKVDKLVGEKAKISKKEILEIEEDEFNIFTLKVSQHSTDSLEEFRKRYIDTEESFKESGLSKLTEDEKKALGLNDED